jgi:hypothetical protein
MEIYIDEACYTCLATRVQEGQAEGYLPLNGENGMIDLMAQAVAGVNLPKQWEIGTLIAL